MDIIPPQLGCLKVYGKLTLLPNLNATIAVTCIEVSLIESAHNCLPLRGAQYTAIASNADLPFNSYELPLQVYGILDISDGNGGPYQGTANIVIYGTKQSAVGTRVN